MVRVIALTSFRERGSRAFQAALQVIQLARGRPTGASAGTRGGDRFFEALDLARETQNVGMVRSINGSRRGELRSFACLRRSAADTMRITRVGEDSGVGF